MGSLGLNIQIISMENEKNKSIVWRSASSITEDVIFNFSLWTPSTILGSGILFFLKKKLSPKKSMSKHWYVFACKLETCFSFFTQPLVQ